MPTRTKQIPQLKNRSLGITLRHKREELGFEINHAAKVTKIRPELIQALEKGNYNAFASEVYAKGFLKNYSAFLGLDSEKTLALYRRETADMQAITQSKSQHSPTKVNLLANDRFLSKRMLITLSVILAIFLIAFYAVNQVNALLRAPELTLTTPVQVSADFDGEILVPGNSFQITGKTAGQTVVRLNSEPLAVQPDLQFETPEIPVHEGTTPIIITATNQFGRTSTIKLSIKKGGGGVVTKTKMSVLIQIENDATSLLVRTDGAIQFNDSAFPGDVISLEAQNRLEIQSTTPYNIKLSINGDDYKFTAQDQLWELLDGKVVQK